MRPKSTLLVTNGTIEGTRPKRRFAHMGKTDAAAVLKSVPLFGALSRSELSDVIDLAREELFSPGQDIVTEGQAGGPFFCITEGRADVLVHDKKVRELTPGSHFGE